MEKLRVTSDKDEIKDIFQLAIKNELKTLVWQTDKTENRELCQAKIVSLNPNREELTIIPVGSGGFSFDKELTLYLRLNFRSILFKTKIQSLGEKLIQFQIPTELRILEQRVNPRVTFSEDQEVKVSFQKPGPYETAGKDFETDLVDISRFGLAYVATALNITKFHAGDKIFIKKIAKTVLDPPVEGEIMYIKPLRKKGSISSNFYRVGVKLKEAINF